MDWAPCRNLCPGSRKSSLSYAKQKPFFRERLLLGRIS
jgi:hypothetical protein